MSLSNQAVKEIFAILDREGVKACALFTLSKEDLMETTLKSDTRDIGEQVLMYSMMATTQIIGREKAELLVDKAHTLPLGDSIYIPESEN